ncbi:transposase [Yinghuangia soli]|uniref:Transposase n=1 Tax=Yinghuangia soli TaxID=2908204 RepID=A0AA41PXU6_9ACTN|nr:transposase [Yinghuangia soli]MCF2527733.1 transposase [Yinghuangia soli]
MTRSMNSARPRSATGTDARAAGRTAAPRTRLTLRDVVLAARGVLADGGVDALTMSAVAARLGVTPMALYRHVDDRAALLAAVADSVLEEVGAGLDPGIPWDDAVVMWMRDVRHRIVQSPWTAQLIGTATQIAPAWAAALDRLLAALERGPLDDAARADVLVWVARTTVGVVLLEAKSPLARPGQAVGAALDTALEGASPEMAERWARIDARLAQYRDDDLFEDLVRQTRARLAAAAGAEPVATECFEKHPQHPDAQDMTDRQWLRVRAVLPAADQRGAPAADDRRIVDGIRHRERTDTAWRNVPARYGSWQTLYNRHRRWTRDGTWDRVTAALGAEDHPAGRGTESHPVEPGAK